MRGFEGLDAWTPPASEARGTAPPRMDLLSYVRPQPKMPPPPRPTLAGAAPDALDQEKKAPPGHPRETSEEFMEAAECLAATPQGWTEASPALPGSAAAAEPLPPTDDPLAVVNRLHEVLIGSGLHADLGLPQIAVVGSQSVGKTSVLQSLVGRDFLPRGSGIVTRRPLVLQLRSTQQDAPAAGAPPGPADASPREWAEFDHLPGERFTDFARVCAEIERETQRVCGENRGISLEPILLRIYSPCVMDLTLVDLPGLTKVPTGDQPSDISESIRNLVLQYVSHESCLILAVSAANADLATSDALALAREVDRRGERTLGVLTKLDVADESSGAIQALQGQIYPLRLGYVGVVCRGEDATRAGVTFEQALKAEEEFLAQSKTFRCVADRCGIQHLAKRLHEVLLQHIRDALPELRARVQGRAEQYRGELAAFGDPGLEQRMGQGAFLLHLISGYARNFADALEGRLAYCQHELPPERLVGGARLHYIFHRIFAQAVLDFDAFSGLSDLEIRVAMRNAAGPKLVPEVAFETLMKRQIQKLEDPSLQCVHLIYEELKQLASQSEVLEMQRFLGLREKVLEVTHGVIKGCLQPTNRMVSDLIRIELAHINTDHPDFIGGPRAMSRIQEEASGQQACAPPQLALPDSQDAPLAAPLAAAAASGSFVQGGKATLGGDAGGVLGARRARRGDPAWGPIPEETLRLPSVPLVVTPSGEPSEKERMDTELLKSFLSSYYQIVKLKIIDAVPKTIMRFMVNAVRDGLHRECIAELYRSDLVASLLQEAEEVRQRRLLCEQKLAELRRAQDILTQVCDAAIYI